MVAVSALLISIAEARERVLRAAVRMRAEAVAVPDALDRVLAESVVAAGDVPPFPCSAMDGYAIKAGPAERTLTVVGESRAGAPARHGLNDDREAIRISTGAAVPAGATAVIRQEDVSADGELRVRTHADVPVGTNVRHAGEDMRAGTAVLSAGVRLGAAELGAAVAAGAGELSVAARPRVSVLCTGDELRAPGEPLGPGEIHNSNAPMLEALARHAGAAPTPARRLPDDPAATQDALAESLASADVVIVTGGVSVGPHDHVKPALGALGVDERFWGVSLQPGKPTWFGTRDRTLVFGLPGNPVSAVVTFSLFVRPALSAMLGDTTAPTREQRAVLGHAVPRNPGREQAVRVRLDRRDGQLVAHLNGGAQGSHILTSLIGADALALIPAGTGELPEGTTVQLEQLAR
jgi:molybdopterin molybdotransferase